jgi:phenylpropionate dioxygenase-like ring-hydroxylating dioxygenase large terminal subunit
MSDDGQLPPEARVRRSPGVSYKELLDRDTRPVPDYLRIDQSTFLGAQDIPIDRYVDAEFHELEKQKLWPKVWQVACREELVPNVGDAQVYEINDVSIFLVRVAPDQIKGFHNACLHMGRQLVDRPCNLTEVRCPYHGFTWALNGKIKHIPSWWDFPQIKANTFGLPEVKVATWGGFVFINMDPDCEPLEAYLGDLDRHFAKYPLSERYTAVHVKKVFRANWKTLQEAFMEGYHTIATHPQILPSAGDENTQYDVFGNYSRAITPSGTPSPHLKWTPTEDELAALSYNRTDPTKDPAVKVPGGMTYRQYGAEQARERFRETIGEKADALCDSELMESFYFSVFPNFHPWSSYNLITHRFMPYGDRPDMSTMEVWFLVPFKGERPPPAKMRFLGPDQSFLEAVEMGQAAGIIAQDEFNIEKVQRGLHTLRKNRAGVTPGVYQHTKIRHFHQLYDRWLGLDQG